MTRGNQREKSREKAAKKLKEQEKRKGGSDKEGPNKGMTLEERRHRDAEIMRQKQVAKAEAEEEKGAVGGASK